MHGSHQNPVKTTRFGQRGDARSVHLSKKYTLNAMASDALSDTLERTGMGYAGNPQSAFGSKNRRPPGWKFH